MSKTGFRAAIFLRKQGYTSKSELYFAPYIRVDLRWCREILLKMYKNMMAVV